MKNKSELTIGLTEVIDYLATLEETEYIKAFKMIEVKRRAEREIAIIEAGSKTAYKKRQKRDDIDIIGDEIDRLK